jgi:hypothetical protein
LSLYAHLKHSLSLPDGFVPTSSIHDDFGGGPTPPPAHAAVGNASPELVPSPPVRRFLTCLILLMYTQAVAQSDAPQSPELEANDTSEDGNAQSDSSDSSAEEAAAESEPQVPAATQEPPDDDDEDYDPDRTCYDVSLRNELEFDFGTVTFEDEQVCILRFDCS